MQALLELVLNNALMAALLAVPAAAISRWGRRPALAHTLWLLVFLKLLTPALIPVSITWSAAAQDPDIPAADSIALAAVPLPSVEEPPQKLLVILPEFAAAPGNESGTELVDGHQAQAPPTEEHRETEEVGVVSDPLLTVSETSSLPLTSLLLVGWLAGSGLWFGWCGLQIHRFQRLLRFAIKAPGDLQRRANDWARRLRLTHRPTVWLIPGFVSPMVWALGKRPRLLFPAELLGQLDREQQDALLAHELAHIYRGDHWVRLLEVLALGIYWWHPVAWWARHELREAEEHCCDAWVVWLLAGARRTYALALIQTVAFFSNARPCLPSVASGIGQVTHLRRRLTMIMQAKTPRSLSWAGGLLVVGLGLLLLPHFPLLGQQPVAPAQPGAGKGDDREEQIRVLRQALELLERQRAADQLQHAKQQKVNAAEVAQARERVQKMAELMEARRNELARTEENYKKALQHLAQLEGGAGGPAFGGAAPALPGAGPGLRKPVTARLRVLNPQDAHSAELEKKLDRLLKEVDELRRAIRQEAVGQAVIGLDTIDFAPGPRNDANAGNDANSWNNSAWYTAISPTATPEEVQKAVELAQKACKVEENNGYFLDTLAAALARVGKFKEAVEVEKKALGAGNLGSEQAGAQERLKLYEAGKPFIQGQGEKK
jgi:beta-lactamase regulating signal transducer with metallopeptidase domain